MTLQIGLCPAPLPGADPPPARSQLPASQAERLKTLELLQQIPIKVWRLSLETQRSCAPCSCRTACPSHADDRNHRQRTLI